MLTMSTPDRDVSGHYPVSRRLTAAKEDDEEMIRPI